MAKHIRTSRRLIQVGTILLASVGCALPNGRSQGDPALGNFNRPIAPTPGVISNTPIYGTPAADGGAAAGLHPTDGTPLTNALHGSSLMVPTYGGSSQFTPHYSLTDAFIPSGLVASAKAAQPNSGARLLGNQNEPTYGAPTPLTTIPAPDAIMVRGTDPTTRLTSGASAVAAMPTPTVKPTNVLAIKQTPHISSIEEGQIVLTSYGAKAQRLDHLENGVWICSCALPADEAGSVHKRLEARNYDQLEAVRALVDQVRLEK